jgi:nicotinate-nucleotide adenylyltransferase
MDTELFEKIRKYTLVAVKKERYEHSMRTAVMAAKMCRLYGVDDYKGMISGIGHDMCKDMGNEMLLSFVHRDGNPITTLEQNKPALLHGRAAAVKLQEDFYVTDAEILQAVANHTFGGEHLCPLAKILFAADKIEPGRPQSNPAYLEKLFSMTLDGLVLYVLQENIDYLHGKGKAVAPVSIRFRDALLAQQKNTGQEKKES